MDHINNLQIHRLIKEFDFVNSDLNYKSEFIRDIDVKFITSVDSFLDRYPELKQAFNDKVGKISISQITESVEDALGPMEYVIEQKNNSSGKIKILYYEIVKIVHPDKLRNDKLNDIYLEATEAYKSNNLLSIISICDKLKIPYHITESEIELIKNEIISIRDRSNFLETTYTYKWYYQQDIVEKEKIILSYIKAQLVK
jgi:hypothetical protein